MAGGYLGPRLRAEDGDPAERPIPPLSARAFNSGFAQAEPAFNGLACGRDGQIYYVLPSASLAVGAQLYAYDPAGDRIRHLGDLTAAAGEAGRHAVPQGKVHTGLAEFAGRLFFATDLDYHGPGPATGASPPDGYRPFPGGHFLAYTPADGRFQDLGVAVPGEGIVSMALDPGRFRLYALTWPSGCLVWLDIRTGERGNLGPVQEGGERRPAGPRYRTICRSLGVDPRDGSVYLSRADGAILRYQYREDAIVMVDRVALRRDYFGSFDPASPTTMGYNWRQVVWSPRDRAFYGVHGGSGYLFRFDPDGGDIAIGPRLASLPSQRSGRADRFAFGYLGFTLGPDGRTLYYLTGAPTAEFHLVTYDLASQCYADHGAVSLADGERPTDINSIAIGRDDAVYALARVASGGHPRTDLIRIAAGPCLLSAVP